MLTGAERTRRWRAAHPERARRLKKLNEPTARDLYLVRTYGISTQKYEEMLKEQGGVCAGCSKPPEKRLHVDHSHTTGEVRGLLCGPCNKALGLIHDSVETLESLAKYLRA